MYVLKYTTITDGPIRKNAMSKFDRAVRLLKGLSDEIQSKVFEYCSEQGWRMLEHDVETTEPVFEEVKQIVLEKAKMIERRKLFSGGQPGFLGTGSSGTPAASTTATMVPTAVTSPVPSASDSIEELTRQITKLTLFLEGQPQPRQQSAPRSSGPPSTNSDRPWQRKCMWCDSVEHTRRDCTEFTEALNAKVVGFNESGRIKLMSTGEELPLMTNRGGMREAVRSRTVETASRVTAVTSVDVDTISFDDQLFESWALKMDQQGLLHWILRTEFVPIKLSMWKQMKNENAMLWSAPDASDLELMDLRKYNQLRNPILAPQIHV